MTGMLRGKFDGSDECPSNMLPASLNVLSSMLGGVG